MSWLYLCSDVTKKFGLLLESSKLCLKIENVVALCSVI